MLRIPAAKWLANKDPEGDYQNMMRLCEALSTTKADKFILISTIDVYPEITGFDESYDVNSKDNHAYGKNRLKFEEFVKNNFSDHHVVRLPALFGEGLKKNVIFDLLHDNQLQNINPDSSFQWYPLRRLHSDIEIVQSNNLRVVNLFTEPVVTKTIVQNFFPNKAIGATPAPQCHYDLRSKYGRIFGGDENYIMSASQVLQEMGQYILVQKL